MLDTIMIMMIWNHSMIQGIKIRVQEIQDVTITIVIAKMIITKVVIIAILRTTIMKMTIIAEAIHVTKAETVQETKAETALETKAEAVAEIHVTHRDLLLKGEIAMRMGGL